MKILAGTRRKRKTPASFTVTPPETDATPQSAASSAAAALAKSGLLAKILWGLLLLSLAESMVLAGMVYRMPMQQFVDQTEAPPDPEQAQMILADQVNLLGLKDKSSPAVAVIPSYDIGPIHSPAVTRLEDADIPGLPANLAKQQQAATAGAGQAMPEAVPAAPPKEEHSDLPAPDQIPRAKMPVLDFHSILEQVLPMGTKPPTTPAHAPDKPAHTPPAPPVQPRAAGPEQPEAKANLPEHTAATPAQPSGPIELYRPRGASAPNVLPPVGAMRITPRPQASSDAAAPRTPAVPPRANQEQADTAARHAVQAPHSASPSDDRPLPPEAIVPRRHLPQAPTPGPALVDRPPVIVSPPVVPPTARLRPPRIIVPVRPSLTRPPIILDRPPPGARLMPPPGARLMPRAPDMDAPVEDRPPPLRDRPARQEDGPDAMPPPAADSAP